MSAERANGETIRALINSGQVTAVHDLSDGGLLVALTEMALAGGIGATVGPLSAADAFGEDQACYLATATGPLPSGTPARRIGRTGGTAIVAGAASIPLATLRIAHEGFFPDLMGR